MSEAVAKVWKRLERSKWDAFISPYSRPKGGQETFEITEIEMSGKAMRAKCRMVDYCPHEDGIWHLRASVAAQMSSELKRIHAHELSGLESREFSALLSDLHMEFKRSIQNPEDISVELEITNEVTRQEAGYLTKIYTWAFSFCDGAFVCESTGHYRRPINQQIAADS